MRHHRSALIRAAAIALAAASLTLGGGVALDAALAQTAKKAVAAKPAAKPNPNINGTWVGQNITYDSGPETNLTANFTTTPWAPLSKGRPEDVKFEPIDIQRARSRKIVEDNVDVFRQRGGGTPPPYTPAGEKAAADMRTARAEEAKTKKPSPYDRCLPTNSFTLFNGNMEIFSANGHMGVLTDGGYRAIHSGSKKENYTPSYAGISMSHWQGDRLVVVTSDWLGDAVNGWPPSEDAKLTETLWIDAKGILNIKAVYEDKQYLKEPMARMTYLRRTRISANEVEYFPANCVADIQGGESFDALFGKEAPQ